MRMSLGTLTVIFCAELAMSQSQTGVDARVASIRVPATPQPCEAQAIAQAIARSAGVAVGFEDLPECTTETSPTKIWQPGPRQVPLAERDTKSLTNVSVRSALDWLTTTTGTFEWREIDGVANVRPKEAWSNAEGLLNLQLAPTQASGVDVGGAVTEIFFGSPSSGPTGRPRFDVSFSGGSVVDGLNYIVRGANAGGWDAITVAQPTNWHEAGPVAVIGIRSLIATGPGYNFYFSAAAAKRQ